MALFKMYATQDILKTVHVLYNPCEFLLKLHFDGDRLLKHPTGLGSEIRLTINIKMTQGKEMCVWQEQNSSLQAFEHSTLCIRSHKKNGLFVAGISQ